MDPRLFLWFSKLGSFLVTTVDILLFADLSQNRFTCVTFFKFSFFRRMFQWEGNCALSSSLQSSHVLSCNDSSMKGEHWARARLQLAAHHRHMYQCRIQRKTGENPILNLIFIHILSKSVKLNSNFGQPTPYWIFCRSVKALKVQTANHLRSGL